MPSPRRVRLIALAIIAILVLTFYYSGEGSSIQNQQFYKSTLEAMKAKEDAKQAAKDALKIKPADVEKPAVPVANVAIEEMEEIPIAGRTKMTVPKKQEAFGSAQVVPVPASGSGSGVGAGVGSGSSSESETKKTEEEEKEEEEKLDAKTELNDILKRAPIIIFSKSYCPYSKKAKHILLDGYTISPKPFVVELDQHPIGADLQALLAQNTGRRTVPNILVNGKSIGGGDDIAALDQSDDLASTLKQYGGKWISDITRGPPKHE
ncbi:hypothetical protein N7540_000387 [Penicillium herquei]|nr:hypothetical protein N7540_000387 [Penicillium herquei]